MIVDITYPIETWPKQNELTHITEGITRSTGGSVCNTISDLARLDPALPLVASGFAGHDAARRSRRPADGAGREAARL